MITAGLLALVLSVGVAVIILLSGQKGVPRRLFVQLSWVPSFALLLEYSLSGILTRTLSYFAILIPLLTCVASLVLAVIGATFIASERQDPQHLPALVSATVIASIPGALLAVYLVYSIVVFFVHTGA